MRKVATFLGAAVALAWLVPTMAQAQAPDMFKDLDTSHWAYPATESLRSKGIVWGYPDGYFRGKRTLTRYEFAVALDRALKSIGTVAGPAGKDGKDGSNGKDGADGKDGAAGPQGPPGMTPEEVDQFRKLLNEFKGELANLGNNVAAMNRKMEGLASSVDALTKRIDKMPTITGAAGFFARSDRANGDYVDYDGRVHLGGAGLVSTPAVVHYFGLGVDAKIPGGGTVSAILTSNNYKGYEGGNLAQLNPLVSAPNSDTYIQQLEINTPFDALGRGSKLTLGRFGERLGHFILWKPDTDRYFMNPFIDDGKVYIDGVRMTGRFGSVDVEVVGGQTKSVTGTNGGPINSPMAGTSIVGGAGFNLFSAGPGGTLVKPFGQPYQGQMTVDQLAAVSAGIGFNAMGQGGHLRVTAMDTSADEPGSAGLGFSNTAVIGANGDLKLTDRATVTADWGKSITGMGRFNTVNPYENNAFNGSVNFNSGGISLNAGYRYIDPLFYAPGYWGRIGNWINPTNIQGPTFRAGYNMSSALGVNFGGDFYSAARNRAGANGGLSTDDEINRLLVGLRWDVAKNFKTTVDWEGVYWKLAGTHAGVTPGGDGNVHPTEQYVTLGTGYNLTSTTLLKLSYTIGDFNGHNFLNSPAGTQYNFNTFTAQASVKF